MSDENVDANAGADANQPMESTDNATAGANANQSDGAGSSTTDSGSAEVSSPTNPPNPTEPVAHQKPPFDVDKAYRSLLPEYQKSRHEINRMRKEYDGLPEPAKIREILAAQQKQEHASKMNVWQKGHQDFGKFQNTLNKARIVGQQIQRINASQEYTPEVKAKMVADLNATLSQDEHGQLESYRQDREQFTTDFHADPKGTIANVAREAAMSVFREGMQAQQADQQVGSWFDQNPEIVQKHAPLMKKVISMAETGDTWPVAQQMAILSEENEQLKAQMAAMSQRVEGADAQSDILNRHAQRITQRDPNTVRFRDDFAQVAKEHQSTDPMAAAALAARRMK